MERSVTTGEPFLHLIYSRNVDKTTEVLHVYIEGDGRPWLAGGQRPADDPTPANPLALHLMAKDNSPALYLGRPCYFGLSKLSPCETRDWTSARYSPEVVASMTSALNTFTTERSISKIVLIGYSGGGALAVLIAPQLATQVRVVTIAANLDTDAWTAAHNYLPLNNSLNPMLSAHMNSVAHHHFAGARDSNVNPYIIQAFARQHGGGFTLQENDNHVCCWEDKWPSLLHNVKSP